MTSPPPVVFSDIRLDVEERGARGSRLANNRLAWIHHCFGGGFVIWRALCACAETPSAIQEAHVQEPLPICYKREFYSTWPGMVVSVA